MTHDIRQIKNEHVNANVNSNEIEDEILSENEN